MADDRIVLKVKYGDMFRRVNLRSLTMDEVHSSLRNLFPSISNYTLSYQDEEGDCILVDSDVELLEAISSSKASNTGRIIRLDVEEVKKEGGAAKKEEVKKEEVKKKEEAKNENERDEKKISDYVTKEVALHSVTTQMAQMVIKMYTPFRPLFEGQLAMAGIDVPGMFLLLEELGQGRDPVVPAGIVGQPMFQCWLGQIRREQNLKERLDKTEEGLKTLKERGCEAPLMSQMMTLWMVGGDADRAEQMLKNHPYGGGFGCGGDPMAGLGGMMGCLGGMMGQMGQQMGGMGMGMGMGMGNGGCAMGGQMGGLSSLLGAFGGMNLNAQSPDDEEGDALEDLLNEVMGDLAGDKKEEEKKEEVAKEEEEVKEEQVKEEVKEEQPKEQPQEEEEVKEDEGVSEEEKEKVELLVSLVGCDAATAKAILEAVGGDLEAALGN